MISIPCAVANEYFRRQISFFEFQHLKVYGDDAKNKAIIPIVKRNNKQEPIQDNEFYKAAKEWLRIYNF